MGHRPPNKMSRADRAKQFLPFAALGGLEEALAKKRRELGLVEKTILSEDALEELNDTLLSLTPGVTVSVRHYRAGEYVITSGLLDDLDQLDACITVGGESIAFEDISDIEITGA